VSHFRTNISYTCLDRWVCRTYRKKRKISNCMYMIIG